MDVETVRIPVNQGTLEGDLVVPARATGVVLFAHGSGSSRKSPRNRFVADILQRAGLATLLIDLLTAAEERVDIETAELRFDIELLAPRLQRAIEWLQQAPPTHGMPIGIFGASTGAAAALIAAARNPKTIAAVVSRGGRPDLAGSALGDVAAPTLLIVGGNDHLVIALNQEARTHLRATTRLEIVAGATHLFEEPGALEQVSKLAQSWFREYLKP